MLHFNAFLFGCGHHTAAWRHPDSPVERLGDNAEKLRHTNCEATAALARPGRYKSVAGNLRVKEVQVAPGGEGGTNSTGSTWSHSPPVKAPSSAELRSGWFAQ